MTETKKSRKAQDESGKEKVVISLDFREIFDAVKKVFGQGKDAVVNLEQDLERKILQAAKKGKLTEEEAGKLMDEYRERFRGRIDKLNEKVDQSVLKTLSALNIATKADVQSLEKRMDMLIERIDALVEKQGKTRKTASRTTARKSASRTTARKTAPKTSARKTAAAKSTSRKSTAKKAD